MKKVRQFAVILFIGFLLFELIGCASQNNVLREWESDSKFHWYANSLYIKKGKHNFSWEVDVFPTETTMGEKIQKCTVCGYEGYIFLLQQTPKGFSFIPAGSYYMGSSKGYSDNKPANKVVIPNDFYISKHEITQAEWETLMGKNPSYFQGEEKIPLNNESQGNRPVEQVSWYDVLVYCNKRSIAEGFTPCYSIGGSTNPEDWGEIPNTRSEKWDTVICNWKANGYRLPTEAEWEYSARAGNLSTENVIYSGTNDISKLDDYAWFAKNSQRVTHEVGKKLENAFGLFDMSGNVLEWNWDLYTTSYNEEEDISIDGLYRVSRGGGYLSTAGSSSVFYRVGAIPSSRYANRGFRVVRITE